MLKPAGTTTWQEWSQRCAALATHPAVLDSRDYWLENSTKATTLQVADTESPIHPGADDLVESARRH